jgi:hypothetical protein
MISHASVLDPQKDEGNGLGDLAYDLHGEGKLILTVRQVLQ